MPSLDNFIHLVANIKDKHYSTSEKINTSSNFEIKFDLYTSKIEKTWCSKQLEIKDTSEEHWAIDLCSSHKTFK